MMIMFDNVTKKFGKKVVLDSISLKISEGITAVTGINGSGRSTFLRIAAGLINIDKGTVSSYSGESYDSYRENIKRYLGYLPQTFAVYENYTLYKYLEYFCVLKCIPASNMHGRIENALNLVNLESLKYKRLNTFSSGQRRRAGIAVSLLNNPEVLILDEPMTGLDVEERICFKNTLLSMEHNKLILMSSNIPTDISDICSHVVVLH